MGACETLVTYYITKRCHNPQDHTRQSVKLDIKWHFPFLWLQILQPNERRSQSTALLLLLQCTGHDVCYGLPDGSCEFLNNLIVVRHFVKFLVKSLAVTVSTMKLRSVDSQLSRQSVRKCNSNNATWVPVSLLCIFLANLPNKWYEIFFYYDCWNHQSEENYRQCQRSEQ